jgi:outer membrane protein OmpA-like peptidoglycan-associated protein
MYSAMKIKTLSILPLLLLAAIGLQAQSWKKTVKCADRLVEKRYLPEAVSKYDKALRHKKLKEDSALTILYKQATALDLLGNTIRSENSYKRIIASGNSSNEVLYNLARARQANGNYAAAASDFEMLFQSTNDERYQRFAELSKSAASRKRNDWNTQRTIFSTHASEYAPAYYKKGIVFSSSRINRGSSPQRIRWNEEPFTSLYSAEEDYKGSLSVVEKLPAPLNSRLNDGAACFNAAYDEVFITRNNTKCKQRNQLQILHSRWNGREWSAPKPLPFQLRGSSYAHPSLSTDGNTLFFSSNQPGTLGGFDIFYAVRNGDTWQAPENAGSNINTPGDEKFPFIAENGTLWFTSDYLPGLGNMDLFYAKREEGGRWTAPINATPINSHRDDFALIFDAKNKRGFFSSNRDGDDDIFSFEKLKSIDDSDKKKQPSKQTIDALVLNAANNTPIPNAMIEIYEPEKVKGFFFYTNNDGRAAIDEVIELGDQVTVSAKGFLPEDLSGAEAVSFLPQGILLKPYLRPEPMVLKLYYDIGKSTPTADGLSALSPLIDSLRKHPNHRILISGYACSIGNYYLNLGLSHDRAKKIEHYLLQKGVNPEDISMTFFGAIGLDKECSRNPKCAAETQRESRRVEVRVEFF